MQLYHSPFCPHSRFVRLLCAERGLEITLVEERAYERRIDFLKLNPEGHLPVLVLADGACVPDATIIAAYLDETEGNGPSLLPTDALARAEVRRLTRWFGVKFFDEVSGLLVTEKIDKRFMASELGGGPPDATAIRAARANIRYHLRYIGWLLSRNDWLAGPAMTEADLMAAAHLSIADYFGDVPWHDDEAAKDWYARIKSRPAFRPLLAERVTGMAPSATYADLDF